jgi:hypothetical protein
MLLPEKIRASSNVLRLSLGSKWDTYLVEDLGNNARGRRFDSFVTAATPTTLFERSRERSGQNCGE